MRVATAFTMMPAVLGASVATVTSGDEGTVFGLRPRQAKHRCPCKKKT
ncbi:MAG: hypothetical protein M0Z95_02020 [Actinomycetota bacterium]|nr:hypothetical protein [Actinomycetota bacterium]